MPKLMMAIKYTAIYFLELESKHTFFLSMKYARKNLKHLDQTSKCKIYTRASIA